MALVGTPSSGDLGVPRGVYSLSAEWPQLFRARGPQLGAARPSNHGQSWLSSEECGDLRDYPDSQASASASAISTLLLGTWDIWELLTPGAPGIGTGSFPQPIQACWRVCAPPALLHGRCCRCGCCLPPGTSGSQPWLLPILGTFGSLL